MLAVFQSRRCQVYSMMGAADVDKMPFVMASYSMEGKHTAAGSVSNRKLLPR